MGSIRLFRRLRLAPGVTLNLARRGPSLSFGVRGAHVTLGRIGRAFLREGPQHLFLIRRNLNQQPHIFDDHRAVLKQDEQCGPPRLPGRQVLGVNSRYNVRAH
jgi:hypothetical protein